MPEVLKMGIAVEQSSIQDYNLQVNKCSAHVDSGCKKTVSSWSTIKKDTMTSATEKNREQLGNCRLALQSIAMSKIMAPSTSIELKSFIKQKESPFG